MAKVNSKDTLSAHPPSVVGPSSNELRPLPEGWVWTTLGKLRKDTRESLNPAKNPEQIFELYSVPSFNGKTPEIVLGKEIGSSKQVVHSSEVLVCKINPRINRAWVVGNHSENPKIASTEWIVFDKTEGLESRFLCYFLQTDAVRDHLAANVSGVGGSLMRARVAAIENYPFPLPPLREQERIVARLEELLSDLEAGAAALGRVRLGVKRYKASALKAACEGRLFGEKPEGLPEGWRWATVEELAKVGTGATPLRSEAKYWEGGSIPWVTSGALNELEVHKADEFITEIALKETNVKIFPAGSLLVAMYGEGKTRGKVSELMIDATTNQACAALVFEGEFIKHKPYVKLFFQKNYEDIRRLSSGGVQPNLNLSIIKNTHIPLPSLEKQRRIVAEVERRLESARAVEAAVQAGLKRAARLRQAVLRSAFEGRLG